MAQDPVVVVTYGLLKIILADTLIDTQISLWPGFPQWCLLLGVSADLLGHKAGAG